MRRTRRRGASGQAMLELAVLLPFLALLFLGSWTVADFIADDNAAVQATQEGARYAAELGNDGWVSPDSTNPTTADEEIIDQMLPILDSQLTNATVQSISIYQPGGSGNGCTYPGTETAPCPPDEGAYLSGDLVDTWPISGTSIGSPTSLTYTLNDRDQTHPDESELGVQVVIAYESPTLQLFSHTSTQYTVVRLAPEE